MLFEGFELVSDDCVKRTVGPMNVGLDDVVGDNDRAPLGLDRTDVGSFELEML